MDHSSVCTCQFVLFRTIQLWYFSCLVAVCLMQCIITLFAAFGPYLLPPVCTDIVTLVWIRGHPVKFTPTVAFLWLMMLYLMIAFFVFQTFVYDMIHQALTKKHIQRRKRSILARKGRNSDSYAVQRGRIEGRLHRCGYRPTLDKFSAVPICLYAWICRSNISCLAPLTPSLFFLWHFPHT